MRQLSIILITLCLFLSSFLLPTNSFAKFEPAPAPPDGYALVYMYRIKVQPSLRQVQILVDGEKTTTLSNNSYTWFYVSPGSHTLRTKWGFMSEVPEIEAVIHFQANAVHYVKMLGSVRNAGSGRFTTYTGIKEVPQVTALAEISKTKKYIPALIEQVSEKMQSPPSKKTREKLAQFQYAPQPPEGQSLVYFYRPKSQPALRSPKVYIDGEPSFKLSNNNYTWLYLKAGSHKINTEWGFLGKSMNRYLNINTASGMTYFLRFSSNGGDFIYTSIEAVDSQLAKKEFLKLKGPIPK